MAKKIIILNDESRICSTTDMAFGHPTEENVFDFPEGFNFNLQYDYKIINDELIYDPIPEPEAEASQLDIIEAQVTYTAMMTDTLLGG